LNNGGLEDIIRTVIWAECAKTTNFFSNIASINANDECPYQIIFGNEPKLPLWRNGCSHHQTWHTREVKKSLLNLYVFAIFS
jgi:hypothetical protein